MKNKSNFVGKARKWAAFGCVLAGVTIAVAATPQDAAAASEKSGKPNVVLMLADNVGWGDIGAYGGGEIRGMADHNIWVRHEGANHQRVRVPSGKLTVHPGSYLGSGTGRPSC